jgi:hypothetical protein
MLPGVERLARVAVAQRQRGGGHGGRVGDLGGAGLDPYDARQQLVHDRPPDHSIDGAGFMTGS